MQLLVANRCIQQLRSLDVDGLCYALVLETETEQGGGPAKPPSLMEYFATRSSNSNFDNDCQLIVYNHVHLGNLPTGLWSGIDKIIAQTEQPCRLRDWSARDSLAQLTCGLVCPVA